MVELPQAENRHHATLPALARNGCRAPLVDCHRPAPKTDAVAALVFLTVRGDGWATNIKDRPITHQTRKLLDKLGIEGNRNFYGCRHSFETIAGDSRDQVAVDAIMGHDDGSMANVYRGRISDERLVAVVEHVRRWLYAEEKPRLKIAEEDVV